jgi:zinc and cadmium transporter
MSSKPFLILVAIVLDGLAGLSGGVFSDRWLIRHQASLIAFAAGAILGAVFLDILPESVREIGPSALTWSFVGFITLALIDWLVGHHHHHQYGMNSPTLSPSLLISDALHNIGDGAAIAAAFLISIKVGLVVAVAVIAHEVPQEVGDYAVLRAAGWQRSHALLALAAVQFTAFLGAVGVMAAAERLHQLTNLVLSIAAGTFLYIGATDLLPEVHARGTASSGAGRILGFVAGIALIGVVSVLFSSVVA